MVGRDPQRARLILPRFLVSAELVEHRTTQMFLQMAQRLTGHAVTKRSRMPFLEPLIKKLQGTKARRA